MGLTRRGPQLLCSGSDDGTNKVSTGALDSDKKKLISTTIITLNNETDRSVQTL